MKAYSTADKIDSVKLLYTGVAQTELTSRELGIPTFGHESFREYVLARGRGNR